MKLNILFLMNFLITLSMLFCTGFHSNSKFSTVSTSKTLIKNTMLSNLRAKVDTLIKKLKNDKISNNEQMTEKAIRDHTTEDKLKDSIMNAFNSLNEDFLNYETILDLDKMNTNDNNKNSFAKQNNDDKSAKVIKEIKKHLNIMKKIRNHENFFNHISVFNSFNKLLKYYRVLTLYDKEIKQNFFHQIESIKKVRADAKITQENINKMMEIFEKIIESKEKIGNNFKNTKDIELKKQMFSNYQIYLDRLTKTEDELNSAREKIIKKIKAIMKYPIRFYRKVDKVNQWKQSIAKISSLNNKIYEIKKHIYNELKEKSINSMEDLENLLSSLKQRNNQNKLRLEAMKKMYDVAGRLWNNKQKLKIVREKIRENINKLKQKLIKLKDVEQMRRHLNHHVQQKLSQKDKENYEKYSQIQHENPFRIFFNHGIQEGNQNFHSNMNDDKRITEQDKETFDYNLPTKKIFIIQNSPALYSNPIRYSIENLHNQIVNSLADARQHCKQVKRANNILYEQIEPNLNSGFDANSIIQNQVYHPRIAEFLKNLAQMSQTAVHQIHYNNKNNDSYHQKLRIIVNKLNEMKEEINGLMENESDQSEENDENSEQIENELPEVNREEETGIVLNEIHKLCDLYNYLRKGSAHNYLRNQFLKRILNFNSTMMNKQKLDKVRLILRYN